MRRLVTLFMAPIPALIPTLAHAEGISGYSRGNAFIYFMAIAAVLVFGIHDVFHRRWLTWTAAIAVPTVLYMMLPAK